MKAPRNSIRGAFFFQTERRSVSARTRAALFFLVGLERPPLNGRVRTKVKFAALLHCPVSTTRTMPSKKAARRGTKAKPLALLLAADGFALFGCQAVKRKRHLKQAKKTLDFLLDAQ